MESRLQTLWWKLNSAMGRTGSVVRWNVLLDARRAVHACMWLIDPEHRAARREIRRDNAGDND